MEATMESSAKAMEATAAHSEVDQQWQLQSAAAVGCSFWQEAAAASGSDSRGSVAEPVPVSNNAIEALQTPANEGTFLCLDCDMPLNIEMKKDHLLVCKSRQPTEDADKTAHNQEIITSTPISRPLLTTMTEETIARPLLGNDETNARPLLVTDGTNARPLLANDETIARPLLASDETIAQPLLATDETIVRPLLATDETITRPLLANDETIAQPLLANDETISRPTLIATMTEEGIVVTTSPNGSLQLMESVENDHYVTSPVLTKLKTLPMVQVICQPNGKQCKVYTDEVENYKCQVCKYTTTTSAKLSAHKCISLAERLRCVECDYVAESSGSLSRHMVSHRKTRFSNEFTLQCPTELDKFVEKRRDAQGGEIFGCSKCNFTSKLYLSIKHHTQTHSVQKPLRCDYCDFSCKLEVNLKNHKLSHEPKEVPPKERKRRVSPMESSSNVCRVCGHVYVENEDPIEHVDMHLKMDVIDDDLLAFRCLVCELSCNSLPEMRVHVRSSHMRGWPHQCQQCRYTCVRLGQMRLHMKLHNKKPQLQCESCDYRCKLISNLKLHMKNEHPRKVVTKKMAATPSKSSVITRKKAKMMRNCLLKCTKCDYTTEDKEDFELHLKTHRSVKVYACKKCDYKCKLLRNYVHHKMTHGQRAAFVKT